MLSTNYLRRTHSQAPNTPHCHVASINNNGLQVIALLLLQRWHRCRGLVGSSSSRDQRSLLGLLRGLCGVSLSWAMLHQLPKDSVRSAFVLFPPPSIYIMSSSAQGLVQNKNQLLLKASFHCFHENNGRDWKKVKFNPGLTPPLFIVVQRMHLSKKVSKKM